MTRQIVLNRKPPMKPDNNALPLLSRFHKTGLAACLLTAFFVSGIALPSANAKTAETIFGLSYGCNINDLNVKFSKAETPMDIGYDLQNIPDPLPSLWHYSVFASPKTGRVHSISAWFVAPKLVLAELDEEQSDNYLAGLVEAFPTKPDRPFLPQVADLVADSFAANPDWTEIPDEIRIVLAREFPRESIARSILENTPGAITPLRAFQSGTRRLFVMCLMNGIIVFATDTNLLQESEREARKPETSQRQSAGRSQLGPQPLSSLPVGIEPMSYEEFQRKAKERMFAKIPEGFPEPDTTRSQVITPSVDVARMTQEDLVQYPKGCLDVKPAGKTEDGIPIYRTMPVGSQVPGRFFAPVFFLGSGGGWEYVEFPPKGEEREILFRQLADKNRAVLQLVESFRRMNQEMELARLRMKHEEALSELEVMRHENRMREIRSEMADMEADRWSRMAPQYVPNYYLRWDGTTVTHDFELSVQTETPFVPFEHIIKAPDGFYK